MLTDDQRADGWIEHDGGPCPITEIRAIEVKIAAGIHGWVMPNAVGWEHRNHQGDIIAYKPENRP